MKIAVYTIAKNEEQFVQRWADSCTDADYRLILDTGSTDRTVDLAHINRIPCVEAVINPWRFDEARNRALANLPHDIDLCIALDMDEILLPGWRQALETLHPVVTRPRYKYVWNWNPDGSEGLVYGGDKIHARHGYTWKHPVHEVITPEIEEIQYWLDGLEIHHHPDHTKSRGQYFDLLKLAVQEDPADPRNQFYLGREYFYQGDYDNARRHLIIVTLIQNWPPEKAAAYRMLYKIDSNPTNLYRALQTDPARRETLVMLAQHYYTQQDWRVCLHYAETALSITEKPLDYLCEADPWGWQPYDLAAISAWNLGNAPLARLYGERASQLNPTNQRLASNVGWYYQGNPV